jgi:hypothetical protein
VADENEQEAWAQSLVNVFRGVRGLILAGVFGGTVVLFGYNQVITLNNTQERSRENRRYIKELRKMDDQLEEDLEENRDQLGKILDNQRFIICNEYARDDFSRLRFECEGIKSER